MHKGVAATCSFPKRTRTGMFLVVSTDKIPHLTGMTPGQLSDFGGRKYDIIYRRNSSKVEAEGLTQLLLVHDVCPLLHP